VYAAGETVYDATAAVELVWDGNKTDMRLTRLDIQALGVTVEGRLSNRWIWSNASY
jgi:hypothetical protein